MFLRHPKVSPLAVEDARSSNPGGIEGRLPLHLKGKRPRRSTFIATYVRRGCVIFGERKPPRDQRHVAWVSDIYACNHGITKHIIHSRRHLLRAFLLLLNIAYRVLLNYGGRIRIYVSYLALYKSMTCYNLQLPAPNCKTFFRRDE